MTYAIRKVKAYSLKTTFGTSHQSLINTGGPQYTSPGSLVGWWRLNEDVSSTLTGSDSAGTGIGVGENPVTFPEGTPDYITVATPSTRIQTATLSFDGTQDYGVVKNPSNNAFTFGDGTTDKPFSWAFWIYPTALTTQRAFLFKGINTGAGREWYCYTTSGGQLYFSLYDGSNGGELATYSTATGVITTGEWIHVAGTYDGRGGSAANEGQALYIDGSQIAVNHTAPDSDYVAMEPTKNDLNIGIWGDQTSNDYYGYISDVAIWKTKLSEDSVSELYNAASYDLYKVSRNFNRVGSVASNSGSINSFRQGIYVDQNKYFVLGLNPKIGAGTRDKILLSGTDVSSKPYFDDLAVFSSGSYFSEVPIQMVPNFEVGPDITLGVAKAFNDDTPFEEMEGFILSGTVGAIEYISDDSGALLYPYVGSNPGARDPYQMNGIIELFEPYRENISLQTPEFPFSARGIWGSLGGYALDSHRGSVLITQQISTVTSSLEPYEDNFNIFAQAYTVYAYQTPGGGTWPYTGSIADPDATTTESSFPGYPENPKYDWVTISTSGSIELPGYLTDKQATVSPWVDELTIEIYSSQLSGSQIQDAVDMMSGSSDGIYTGIGNGGITPGIYSPVGGGQLLKRNHKSATAGFVYNNNSTIGTDSITFGGWKK